MPTTPTYGLPYPALTDAPDGPAQMQALAAGVEDELERVDADLATLKPVTTWATYTPGFTGSGAPGFNLAGRWRRIGPKTVAVNAQFTFPNAGAGSGVCIFSLPTAPSRTIRQTIAGHSESPGATLNAIFYNSGQGGTGNFCDRILWNNSAQIKNMQGSDIAAGCIVTFSGVYEEA